MRMIKFKCNDHERVRAVCVGNCNWVCFASAVNGSEWVQVKKLVDVHDCGTLDHNFHANSTWLAQRYATQLSRLHNWDMRTFKQHDYVVELRRTNVGNTVIIKCELEGERPRFQNIYICLAAVKQGFLQGCRPVIGFDVCHIKGHHPGQLLSVVSMDPSNDMYLIAYAVAEVEKYETWSWFCQLGLVLKLQMEKIARSTTIPWWDAEMKNMRHLSQAAFDWVVALDPSQWCRAHFKTHSKCDILLKNMCEAFNGALVEVRDKSILTLLERIRYYIMLLMATRRTSCERWKHDIGPIIFGILEKRKKESAWCIPKLADESLYEVKNYYGS
ncbi:uncharacterized protein LOC18792877 [Prunus persica]|uniref:uncharacterized protein LOC18792877 n=1 Tax=Prunus persica TaxID=3760 RepID=UPI0009AB5441|nr:uncharacterized protein LOC18792877 [Prunus persica]